MFGNCFREIVISTGDVLYTFFQIYYYSVIIQLYLPNHLHYIIKLGNCLQFLNAASPYSNVTR